MMNRRRFMVLIAAAPLVMAVVGRSRSAWAADAAKNKSLDSIRKGWRSLLARDAKVSLSAEPLRKSQAEWKKTLSEPQFYVLREEGTERPFSHPLNDEKRPGIYACAGCALPLFTSAMKDRKSTRLNSSHSSIS